MKKNVKKKKNYINNKDLCAAIIKYRECLMEAQKNGQEIPQIHDYIGKAIQMLCNNLSVRPNFNGYSYKSEMVRDAVVDCVAAVKNFNPDITNNAFSYFTTIAWSAFIRRIHKEKLQQYVKHKNYENQFLFHDLTSEDDLNKHVSNEFSIEIIRSFEEKNKKKC